MTADFDEILPDAGVPEPPEMVAKHYLQNIHVPNIDHVMFTLLIEYIMQHKKESKFTPISNSADLDSICHSHRCKRVDHKTISQKMGVNTKRATRYRYVPFVYMRANSDLTSCECYNDWCASCFVDIALATGMICNTGIDCPSCGGQIKFNMFEAVCSFVEPKKKQGRTRGYSKKEAQEDDSSGEGKPVSKKVKMLNSNGQQEYDVGI